MAFTSLSQALDLDPKEMSCENFFLHVALYFLCDRKFSFSLLILILLTWDFFVPIIFYTPAPMEIGLCLEQFWEAVWLEAGLHSRDCSCLAQEWCASSTGALKQAPSSCHGPPEEVLLSHIRLQVGWGFCFSLTWHRACDPRSAALCAKVKVMKAATDELFF